MKLTELVNADDVHERDMLDPNYRAEYYRSKLEEADDLLEAAWGIIANAGWDEWQKEHDLPKSPGWLDAVLKWRYDYFDYVRTHVT
jgi:hypothetical protein